MFVVRDVGQFVWPAKMIDRLQTRAPFTDVKTTIIIINYLAQLLSVSAIDCRTVARRALWSLKPRKIDFTATERYITLYKFNFGF